ncbi:hypothetical protein [Amnibacterium kyonggiense]|uniref:DUF5709 domain-containing protein n=1 Tax=Amnibacterium kyonggiense TaxID=595671 RepID=A0A4V3EAL8_9MICO|nr:hypothetical protein [Amnibacterium kyonggiense]TDS77124.1 hypothetical protein CLV52_2064 [Amnibacterium kyonggiense]
MSSSDPFLPVPPEEAADVEERRELADLEDDEQPDVLTGSAEEHNAEELAAADRAAEPGRFRRPEPGDRLTAEELAGELD